MSHYRYQTRALILGSTPIGEANRFIDMLSEDFGRIRAMARSVREERSKLRYSLQEFSISDISLVRGKEIWRIVGAEARSNFHGELKERRSETDVMLRLLLLLRRLVHGEEESGELFKVVSDTLLFLENNSLSKEDENNFECLVVLRVLYNLGYVAKDNNNIEFLETSHMDTRLMLQMSRVRPKMIIQINNALQESQL